MIEQLHAAASRGDLTVMNTLISTKLNAMTTDDPEHTRLERKSSFIHRLFGRSNSRIIKSLSASSSSLIDNEELLDYINMPNQYGMTALHAACFHGQFHAVQLLLFHGADPNIQARQMSVEPSWTFPLHLAAFKGNLKIIECLLNAGADPYLLDFRGWDAAEVAGRSKHGKIAKFIRDHVRKRVINSTSTTHISLLKHYCKNNTSTINDHDGNHSDSKLIFCKKDDIPKPKFSSQIDLHQTGISEVLVLPDGPWNKDDMYCDKRLRKFSSMDDVFLEQ